MVQNTYLKDFDPVEMIIDKVFSGCMCVTALPLLILSLSWSIYFIIKIIKEKKYKKYLNKAHHLIHKDVWLEKINNSQRKVVKYSFLIAISTIEWAFLFSLLVNGAFKSYKHMISMLSHLHSPKIGFSNPLWHLISKAFVHKLLNSSAVIALILLITLIRILSQYLCKQYSYFSDKTFKLSVIFKRVILILLLTFLLGLFRLTIPFQWVISYIIICYEFFYLTKAIKCLCNLLYKRYFDAKTHEYQPKYIIRYYKWAYWEFKIGSHILWISMFVHFIGLNIFVYFAFICFILLHPTNWIQVLLQNADISGFNTLSHRKEELIDILRKVATLTGLFLFTIGLWLIFIPYLMVSLKVLITAIQRFLKRSNDYANHDLIRVLIERHNSAYYCYR